MKREKKPSSMATSKPPKECYMWDAQVPLKHLLLVERRRQDHQGRCLMNRINALMGRDFCLFPHLCCPPYEEMRTPKRSSPEPQRRCSSEPQREFSPESSHASNLISDFQSPKCEKQISYVYKLRSLWYS